VSPGTCRPAGLAAACRWPSLSSSRIVRGLQTHRYRVSPPPATPGSSGRSRTKLGNPALNPLRVGILTISDACSRGERADSSGDLIASWARERGYTIGARALVPDETGQISRIIAEWADGDHADVVLTTGGTGLTERDVTPEATEAILQKEAPGIAEALRMSAFPRFPRSALSRGTAGVRAKTLIVNLPGSPGGVRDGLGVLAGLVEHAVELVRGVKTEH
jgi:molybdopterin adenylyltransferase